MVEVTKTTLTKKVVTETFVVKVSEEQYQNEIYSSHPLGEYHNQENFMEKATGEIEISIVDVKFENGYVELVGERTSRTILKE